jgi:BirA family biotin operon repressor/biotin-[acetyl-CoA-carboxylase] ligase
MPTEPFDLRAVEQSIAGTEFAGHLTHLTSVTSTNDLALQAAQSGARHGIWIADAQTAGRGRGNHAWYSAVGTPLEPAGLYMTALIAPPVAMQHALSLSLTTAIAVQSAISSVAGFRRRDQIDIRWPNDLLLNARKCGGILTETASNPATPTQPATLRYAVIGIGINVNHTIFPHELDPIATSLRRELPDPSQPLRREPLAAAILLALDQEIRRLTSNLEPRTSDLTQFSSWISGKRVRVEERNDDPGGYTGITAGLDRSGFLLVNGDDGQLHTVLSGGLREP